MKSNHSIIAQAFLDYRDRLINYVSCRIHDREEAADIVQDVFLCLCNYTVVTEATIKSLLFTMANNLVLDYVRRHYVRQRAYSCVYDMEVAQQPHTPEQIAVFHDIEDKERCIMLSMPKASARVYELTRMDGKTIDEIATQLAVSRRTVECHQYNSRRIMRQCLGAII